MTWIFGSFLVTPDTLTSCHAVISKQGSTIRVLGYNRCVTGRRQRDENQAVRFGQIVENQSRAWDTQPIRGVSACKGVQALAPLTSGRRYGKKKSSLWVYVSPSISQLTTNCGPFSRIKWEIYFYKEVFRSFIEFRIIIMTIQQYIKFLEEKKSK